MSLIDEFGRTNTNRPKLLRKRTFLMPMELNDDLEAAAAKLGVSVNEVVLNALEGHFARRAMTELPFALDYYLHIRPMKAEMEVKGCRSFGLFIGHLWEQASFWRHHPIQ